MADNTAIEAAAIRLRASAGSFVTCAPVRNLIGADNIAAAYAVQQSNVDAAVAAGARISGRKIGLTSPAVQKQLGVDQPDFGTLFADREFADGAAIAHASLLQPRIEAEVAFILGRDITTPSPGFAELTGAIAYAVPALEVVASRISDWDIKIADTIADNASFGAYVLGSPLRSLAGLELKTCAMNLKVNDVERSVGSGAACLGSPLSAALWLVRKLATMGTPLNAGDVIMSGALGPMVPVAAGDRVEAEIAGLGSVSCSFV